MATLPSQSPAWVLVGLHRPVQIGVKRLASKGVLASYAPAHTEVSADYQLPRILNKCRKRTGMSGEGGAATADGTCRCLYGRCTCETILAIQTWREPWIIIRVYSGSGTYLAATRCLAGKHRLVRICTTMRMPLGERGMHANIRTRRTLYKTSPHA